MIRAGPLLHTRIIRRIPDDAEVDLRWFHPPFAARTIARIPARSASGRSGHAFTNSARSGDSRSKSAKKHAKFSPSVLEVLADTAFALLPQWTENPCVAGSTPALPITSEAPEDGALSLVLPGDSALPTLAPFHSTGLHQTLANWAV